MNVSDKLIKIKIDYTFYNIIIKSIMSSSECNCRNKDLKCCSICLSDDEQDIMYDKVMNKAVCDRIKDGCECYMCNDKESCTCIDLSIFYKIGGRYRQNLIDKEIEAIKKKISCS